MPTMIERDIYDAIKEARGREEHGAAAQAMALLETTRQQRAGNMIALAGLLEQRGCSPFEQRLVQNLLHASADILGMRADGSVIA